MPSRVRHRLTTCLAATAATVALGVALAPAASADPPSATTGPGTSLLAHLGAIGSNAPNVLKHVPPFGRKLG